MDEFVKLFEKDTAAAVLLAAELSADKIRVNSVSPDAVIADSNI